MQDVRGKNASFLPAVGITVGIRRHLGFYIIFRMK